MLRLPSESAAVLSVYVDDFKLVGRNVGTDVAKVPKTHRSCKPSSVVGSRGFGCTLCLADNDESVPM